MFTQKTSCLLALTLLVLLLGASADADTLARAVQFDDPVSPPEDYSVCYNPFLGFFSTAGYHLGDDYNRLDTTPGGSCSRINDCNRDVIASSAGRVTYSKVPLTQADRPCSGVRVHLEHLLPEGGKVCSQYLHFQHPSDSTFDTLCANYKPDTCSPWSEYVLPSVGSVLGRGVKIGQIGTTGASTGSHLHFEIRLDWPTCRLEPGLSYISSLATENDIRTLNARIDPESYIEQGVMSFVQPLLSTGWRRFRNNFEESIDPSTSNLYRRNEAFESGIEKLSWSGAVGAGWVLNSFYAETNHQAVATLLPGDYYWIYVLEDDLLLSTYGERRQDFYVGDSVRTIASSNIRSSPGIGDNVLGTQPAGAQGVVRSGPNRDGDGLNDPSTTNETFGYSWFDVDFPSDADGWMATTQLAVNQPTESPPPFCPAPTSGSLTAQISRKISCQPPPEEPAVSTGSGSGVTESSASLNMAVHPNGSSTLAWFQWGTTSSLGSSTEKENIGNGTSEVDVSITLTGLDCDEDYFFRAVAENSAGTSFGSTRSFNTANCSSGGGGTETRELLFNGDFEQGETFWSTDGDFHIGAASRPRSGSFYAFLSTAQWDAGNDLSGEILNVITDVPANAESVDFSFWYSITTDETTTTSEFDRLHIDIIDFGGSTDRKLTLSNLNSTGGAYNFRSFDISHLAGRSIGVNFIGFTDFSLPTVFRIDDVSVKAVVPEEGIPPFVVTQEADQITSLSVRLNLSVDPNELETDVWFEWGEGSSLSSSTDRIAVGGGSTIFDVSDSLFDLDCETTYSFRALAQNSQGTDQGLPRTFTTGSCPGGPPFADTDPADSITANSGRLTAEINPNDTPTEGWFDWGTTTSLGTSTSRRKFPADNQYLDLTETVSDLDCDTTYYFQAVAQNAHGADRGAIHSFTTSDCGGGGGPAPGGHVAWAERQSCHGNLPALLLKWSPVEGASSIYTIERLDGGYNAVVDTIEAGFAHLVTQNLDYDQRYEFRVLAETGSGLTASNIVETFVIDRDCVVAGEPASPPGPFIAWLEPTFCNDGSLAVEINWSESAGAASYTLERLAATGGVKRTVTDLQGPAFLDSSDLFPGILHAYILTAVNEAGTTRAQLVPQFLPEPGLCHESGLPSEFVLTAGTPFCSNGKPIIPIGWTASSGADDFYRLRAFGEQGRTAAAGISTDNLGFTYDLELDFSPGAVYQLYMIAESSQDPTKKRFSNSVFVYLPVNICPQSFQAPDVNSKPPIALIEDGATLQASVRPNSSRTQVWFEWGTTAGYGNITAPLDVGDGAFYLWPSTELIDLACETEYHHRAVAQNSIGMGFGSDISFTTAACSPGNQAPFIAILEPDGVDDYARDRYYIQWTDSDPDNDASISLAYSIASSCSSATLIRDNISEDDTSNFFLWYTSGLAAGNYYILATIDDGVNAPVSACSSGPVAVDPNGSFLFADGFESGGVFPWALVRPALGQGLSVIGAAANSGAYGARLTLTGCSAIRDLLVPDQVVSSEQTFTGCDTVTAGNVDITTGGSVTFEAGKRIAIGSGFSVGSGASFRAIADPVVRGEGFLEDRSPEGEKEYFATFFSNLSQLTIPDTDRFEHFVGYNGNDVPQFSIVIFGDAAEAYSTRAYISARRSDGTYWTSEFSGGIGIPPGWWPMEVHWVSASALGVPDGSVGLCIQNTQSTKDCNSFSHDNPGTMDFVRWGVLNIDGTVTGIVNFDDFHSQNTFPTLP